jgi:RimJ/RimL family protein N-acetyltransferase
MIYQLDPDTYESVRPLFKGLAWNLISTAVIEGTCPGDIYVDDVKTPETALIVSPQGYYLAGYEDNQEFNSELRNVLDNTIIPEKIKKGEENISLNYYPAAWEHTVEIILQGKYPVKVHGYYYTFSHLRVDWRREVPPGGCVVRVDEALLERTDVKNVDKVTDCTKETWNSSEDFLQHGVGFCLLYEDAVVCWCLTDCVSGTKCEIGIETEPDYQRRGFATITGAATVEYCLSHGFTDIGWHTGVTNVASIKTAEKVGFEKVLEDTYWFCWFYPVDNFIEHGYFSWLEGEYRESAQWYERAITIAESGEYDSFQMPRHTLQSLYYYAACSWALAGEKDSSFKNLDKAVRSEKNPQQAAERLKNNEYLKHLHGTEEWNRLIEVLEKGKGGQQ